MNEGVTGETIWRGRLTEDGPPMRVIENGWGQFLQADDVRCEAPLHNEVDERLKPAGMLF